MNEPVEPQTGFESYQIASGVPEEVLEVLDKDDIEELEYANRTLVWLEQQRLAPNPFNKQWSGTADFGFLKPSKAKEINEFIAAMSGGSRQLFDGWRTGQLFGRAKKIETLASEAILAIENNIDAVRALIDEKTVVINRLTDEYIASRQTPDFLAIEVEINALTVLAKDFPSAATLSRIEDLSKLSLELLQKLAQKTTLSPVARSGISIHVEGTEKTSKRAKWLKRYAKASMDVGAADYEILRIPIAHEEAILAATVLVIAERTQKLAIDKIDPEDLSKASVVDNYLATKRSLAKQCLENTDRTILEYPTVKAALSRLNKNSLTGELISVTKQQEIELSRDLRSRLGDANDILLGGRRLKPTKRIPKVTQLSDHLEALMVDEDQKAQVERGLIISILTDRFNTFMATIEKLKEPLEDPAIALVEGQKPDVVRALRELDLLQRFRFIEALIAKYAEQLTELLGVEEIQKVRKTISEYLKNPEEQIEEHIAPRKIEDLLPPTELVGELDWTVLPYGEAGEQELEKAAREIVEEAKKRVARGFDVELDLRRIEILKNIRKSWGTDRCHYERGMLKDRSKVVIDGEGCPDEYIVLVLQQLDQSGNVIMEHAIAESPIARHNALYVFRADAEHSRGFTWREVFSVSKKDAREIGGARPLKHTKGDGRPLVDFLTDRVNFLLNCPAENFHILRFQGPTTWISRQIGKLASQ